MKKWTAWIMILVMILLCFTGCMRSESTLVLHKDGTSVVTNVTWFEKKGTDELSASMGMTPADMGIINPSLEVIDGTEYYKVEDRMEFASFKELKTKLEENGYRNVYVSANGISYDLVSEVSAGDIAAAESMGVDLNEFMSTKITITLPKKIVFTTGTVSGDGKTAEFSFKAEELLKAQSVVVSSVPEGKETVKPTVSGAKHKTTYNSARTITAKDASGIKKMQYKYKASADGEYGKYTTFSGSRTFTKNGTYYVRVYDNYGNKTVRIFTIKDTKKPAVTLEGTMNKKQTYYKDSCKVTISDNCKVKSVKYYINGNQSEVKLADVLAGGITADQAGDYKITVTDVNGHKKTVTFKVK